MKNFRFFIIGLLLATMALFSHQPAIAAGPMTYYTQNYLIDYLFRAQASGTPTTWYIALYTTCPTDTAGSGTEVANANAYARQSVGANALTNWAATQGGTAVSSGTTGQTSNLATITFPTVTTATWGTINCWALVDSGTWGGGNVWIYAPVTTPPTLTVGATASFAIGALTFTLTP
jgi:hypothetical protein